MKTENTDEPNSEPPMELVPSLGSFSKGRFFLLKNDVRKKNSCAGDDAAGPLRLPDGRRRDQPEGVAARQALVRAGGPYRKPFCILTKAIPKNL